MSRSVASRRLRLCGVALLIAATGCDLRAGPDVRETALRIRDAGLPPPVDAGGPPRDAGARPAAAVGRVVPAVGRNGDETTCSCSSDCGPSCGDGCCDPASEDACGCPSDCSPVEGDNCCTGGENSATPPCDCPATCGDGICNSDATTCDDGLENSCTARRTAARSAATAAATAGSRAIRPAPGSASATAATTRSRSATTCARSTSTARTTGSAAAAGGRASARTAPGAPPARRTEALEYVAQITSKALPDGSLEVKGSLLLKGGKSYSVVGEPIIVKIAQGSATGMPQQARTVAAVTDIVGQLETRYAAQLANATRTGFTCRALTWAGKNLPKIGLIGAIFILVEVSALAGEHLPPLIIPNTVAKLKGEGGLRERCTEFSTWYKKLFMEEEHPMQQGTSCETCVERSIGTAPPCEGTTDQCTWCSQSATNPNAAYQDLKNGVENLKWHFAKACAGRPGGYFTRRHGGENGLRRQVAAGYTVDAICPHR